MALEIYLRRMSLGKKQSFNFIIYNHVAKKKGAPFSVFFKKKCQSLRGRKTSNALLVYEQCVGGIGVITF